MERVTSHDDHDDHVEHAEGETAFGDDHLNGGVAFTSTPSHGPQQIPYVEIDGLAIAEGDIILGTIDEIRRGGLDDELFGVGIEQERFRWTNGTVPFVVQDGFEDRDRQEITDAIAHWRQRTKLRFVERTTQADYVEFQPATVCSSFVGMRGGKQPIKLAPACSLGSVIHEIGHAIGLWHEQTREDRDAFVTINWENIKPSAVGNFTKRTTTGVDIGEYDYGSIMHYPRRAFSQNGRDTIVPTRPDVMIGQRNALSGGDVASVRWMYPNLEPSRPSRGVQFQGTVGANSTRTWFTRSWPTHWYVDWSVMPLTPIRDGATQLSLEVRTSRQTERFAKYHLVVRNHSDEPVTFEARYAVHGWSRAARDEIPATTEIDTRLAADAGDPDTAADTDAGTAAPRRPDHGAHDLHP